LNTFLVVPLFNYLLLDFYYSIDLSSSKRGRSFLILFKNKTESSDE